MVATARIGLGPADQFGLATGDLFAEFLGECCAFLLEVNCLIGSRLVFRPGRDFAMDDDARQES